MSASTATIAAKSASRVVKIDEIPLDDIDTASEFATVNYFAFKSVKSFTNDFCQYCEEQFGSRPTLINLYFIPNERMFHDSQFGPQLRMKVIAALFKLPDGTQKLFGHVKINEIFELPTTCESGPAPGVFVTKNDTNGKLQKLIDPNQALQALEITTKLRTFNGNDYYSSRILTTKNDKLIDKIYDHAIPDAEPEHIDEDVDVEIE